MSRIPSLSPVAQTGLRAPSNTNDLRQVNMDQFLQLLIAELQNQDPMSPMENSEILQQISQIREISATNQLSDTLTTVTMGQELATASSLIGQRIRALSEEASAIEGEVDRVSIETDEKDKSKRILRIHVGDERIRMENIREILS